ncbi:DUF6708 domain-containing protein [Stenotrophomonas sp. MMGLT7]|uniref:DUF6708 domain-containing protein n=1 Tax=Stenotrophomonas sp. MMGLT7 TaxID=2901227 RepID=UPI001E309491|nr:DUF6708 domain-containing protein [Stenotrophomonas sp. MMGLT7]MCD7099526.1 hypothetical protein [Stenotrophomonas sp. MMGLT7]
MDYAGLDYRNIRYPVNRPLTDKERSLQYRQGEEKAAQPMDFLSVIGVNSSYIDLVDRWYPIKGFNVWLGGCVIGVSAFLSSIIVWAFFWAPVTDQRGALWFMLLVFMPIALALIWGGWWLIRTESWRWTHYPMRLNRKTRQVYVFRQDGTVLTVPWDDLFIVRGEAKNPIAGTTYDLRAHVLDKDGITVRESFSLGYAFPGDEHSMDKFWAFLQPYMEAQDGAERTYRHLKKNGYLAPLDGRKEGWRWSIARSFMSAAHWPWLQFLGAPFLGLNAVGRMFAMRTSKRPRWPKEVEDANTVEADDPYVLTWRDNGPLGWWELGWPSICTVLGVGLYVGVIAWMLFQL